MLVYYSTGSVQTRTVWPEIPATIALEVSGGLDVVLTQDYDESQTIVPATIINSPTSVNPRIIFQVDLTDLPTYSGLYTAKIREFKQERPKWGTTNIKWTDADWRWSDVLAKTLIRTIDNDRAWISGSDIPIFTSYVTSSTETIYQSGSVIPSPTQYISSNETGAYTTYHT